MKLTADKVKAIAEGTHADGGGLYLQVTDVGAKSWLYRYQIAGRRRWMGVGAIQADGAEVPPASSDGWRHTRSSGGSGGRCQPRSSPSSSSRATEQRYRS